MEIHVEFKDCKDLSLVQKVFIGIIGTLLLTLIATVVLPIPADIKQWLYFIGSGGLLLIVLALAFIASAS